LSILVPPWRELNREFLPAFLASPLQYSFTGASSRSDQKSVRFGSFSLFGLICE
jgi:hypothetical protein